MNPKPKTIKFDYNDPTAEVSVYHPQIRSWREKLIRRMIVENIKNLSSTEIQRTLGETVAADRNIELATKLIEIGALTMTDIEEARNQ